MIPTNWQNIVISDEHRFRVLCCGRRSGKTSLAAEEIKGRALFHPNKIAYIATTYSQARSIMWEELRRELKPIFSGQPNEARLEIRTKTKVPGKESIITLYGWESIDTLRGLSFDFIVLDEVAHMRNFDESWKEVIRPTLTDRKGEALFCSSPRGFNHFYKLYNMELEDKDYKSFRFPSSANPHLPVEEIEKARKELSDAQFHQEYMAEFTKVEGLVYKEFSREKHLYDTLPEGKYQKYGSVDFGYRHPAAVLDVRFDGEKLWVENEWYKSGKTDAQIADYVAASKFKAVFPDPENQGAIEELKRRGVNIREVVKGKGSVAAGIQSIRELFLRGDLMINKHCTNLISELEMYSYDSDSAPGENPIKEFDDACDSLRYLVSSLWAVIMRSERLASTPRPRDEVYTNPAL